jgi:hypothetical protein
MGKRDQDLMAADGAELRCRIAPAGARLLSYVESAARAAGRPVRPLHLQALLQLPRLADSDGWAAGSVVEELLEEIALELPGAEEWLVADAGDSPRGLNFHEMDAEAARDVMQRFHYLRSPRRDGRAYGLSTQDGRLAALCVSSPLDVALLGEILAASGGAPETARVISRVFVFEGAPGNSISYMLSRAGREEKRFGVTDLLTYVNPNMGFSGSSYLASGWQKLGIEEGTKYRYLDARYITDRELAGRFGMHDDRGYERLLGGRFAVSVMALEPLKVFHRAFWRERSEQTASGE